MEFLSALKERIPDYAKGIRLNLDGVIARSSIDAADALGAALAAAYAARSKTIMDALRGSGALSAVRRCKLYWREPMAFALARQRSESSSGRRAFLLLIR